MTPSREGREAERALQLARREGFKACFTEASWHQSASGWVFCNGRTGARLSVSGGIDAYVAERYPLPVEEVPNEITDEQGDKWRWMNGRLQMQRVGRGNWLEVGLSDITDATRPTIARVLLNPRIPAPASSAKSAVQDSETPVSPASL